MAITKAFAYLRVSGKGQVEGDGFPRQLSEIKKYAAAAGIKLAKVYREEGVSGTTDLEHRPAFLELLADLLADGVKTILVEKLDRLARDLMVQEAIIRDLKKRGFELVSVLEPDLCSDDPTRKLMRQMLGAIAEYEKTMIVLKLRGARGRQRSKTGRCEGRKPYGTHPGEAEVLVRMRELRAAGLSYAAIAQQLDAAGARSRTGRPWNALVIGRILNNWNERRQRRMVSSSG